MIGVAPSVAAAAEGAGRSDQNVSALTFLKEIRHQVQPALCAAALSTPPSQH